MSDCVGCPYEGQQQVPSEGNPDTCKYVLIGEAPAYDEMRLKRPFVGETGRLLIAFLTKAGIKREECYICNALLCQLPKNKKGLSQALKHCRPRLLAELSRMNTGATWAIMGTIARDALYPAETGKGILAAKGWRNFEGHDALVMVHPAYYLYNPNEAPMLVTDLKRLKRCRLPPIGPFELTFQDQADFEDPSVQYYGASPHGYYRAYKMLSAGLKEVLTGCDEPKPEYVAYILDTPDKLDEFVRSLHRRPMKDRDLVSFDLETDQVDFQRDRILCMSVSLEEGTAYIIPDLLLYQDRHEFVTTGKSKTWWKAFLTDERYLSGSYLRPDYNTVATLREMFAVPGYRWAGHNAKFDLRFLNHLGVVNAKCDFDTIVAHYALDERKGGHALKPLGDDYFDVGDYEVDLFKYIEKKSARYSQIPRNVLYKYNAMDTEITLRLARTLEVDLKLKGLYERPFMYPMMAAVPMLLDAEVDGVLIDWDEAERIDVEELQPELLKVREVLRKLSGDPTLNPLSSKKVIELMYDKFKFPMINVRTRAAGKRIYARSTQKAVMDGWAKMWERGTLKVTDLAWDFAVQLVHYRHLRKMQGSYIRKWRKFRGTDDRVHTSFLLRGTVTGRLSSKDPPLQTIPSKIQDKWGPLIASIHIAQPGWKLVYADYSQAELMIAACLSGDPFMIQTFLKGDVDYHRDVAIAAFGENFTRDHRQMSKKLTFGWLYGGNVKEIALEALQFEGSVAERFAHEWDDRFAGVLAWRKKQQQHMKEFGYVESMLGRRRRYTLLSRVNFGKAMRVAINAPIQAAASDLTLLSAVEMHKRYKSSDFARVILLIHDAFVMEVRDDKVEEVSPIMNSVMLETARTYFPQVPFKADVKVGTKLSEF